MTPSAVRVLLSFVPTEPTTAETPANPGPKDQGKARHGRLLGLVRKIIDYGRDLVATLQRQNAPTPAPNLARRFGTFNLVLIVARISRGLLLAAGLEARLVRTPPADMAPRSNPNRPTNPRPARRPRPPLSEDDAALLRALPSAEDIAERIRHRPTGAVIVEICRDLGIGSSHPLWREISDAIVEFNGNLVRVLNIWLAQASAFLAASSGVSLASPDRGAPLTAGTGPP